MCTAFLAGDLFNLYVGFEVLLSASFVLLTIGASEERVRAGISYVMVSMVSSLIFLIGLALIYAATGTLNMAELSLRLHDISGAPAVRCSRSCWWPSGSRRRSSRCRRGYRTPTPPHPPGDRGVRRAADQSRCVRHHPGPLAAVPAGGLNEVLLVAALLTMLVGILGAIAQSDIKRLLSFTLVSHIGYMVFGIALSSRLGMSGAIYYVAHHIVVQTTLFLVVGLIERQAGASTLRRLGDWPPPVRCWRSSSWFRPSISVAYRRFRASSARWRCSRPDPRTVRCWRGCWSAVRW